MDVKSLYTNIPNNEALQAIKYFLKKFKIDVDHTAILKLSELVLTVNCFVFDDEPYQQVNGMLMGCPVAREAADIHQSLHE